MNIVKKIFNTKTPTIPKFNDINNISNIVLISFFITIIASFLGIPSAEFYFQSLEENIQVFFPYLLMQLLFLSIFSNFLQRTNKMLGLLVIILLNIIAVTIVYSFISKSFTAVVDSYFNSMKYYFISLGMLFLFLVYFDWKEKYLIPMNTIARLNFLQSKMRPHFLFNTINTSIALIKKDPTVSAEMLSNLSDLIRESLYVGDETTTKTIEEEVDLVTKYLNIEKIRLKERLNVNLNIQEETLDVEIPNFVLQPLVENAVLHGIQTMNEGGTININIEVKNNSYVSIIIQNNYNFKERKRRNSITYSNLTERLMLYYGDHARINVEHGDSTYSVQLILPFETSLSL